MNTLFEFHFKISHIIYEGDNDFKIVKTSKKHLKFEHEQTDNLEAPSRLSISGNMNNVQNGDYVHAYGQWIYSKKYGWSIKAEGCTLEIPSNIVGIKTFLCRTCRGIGTKTAALITDKFGEDTIHVILNEPSKLSEIRGISPKKATSIHKSIKKHQSMEQLSVFLFSHGNCSYNEVFSIYNAMGDNALDKIMTNPYSISREVSPTKFSLADRIALSSGYSLDSEERLKNIILFFLSLQEFSSGDMFAFQSTLINDIQTYLSTNKIAPCTILQNTEVFNKCLDSLLKEKLINIVFIEKANDYGVCLCKNYVLEKNISSYINKICETKYYKPYNNFDKFVTEFQQKNNIIFATQQLEAIRKAMAYRLSLITGGAGTGKTETIRGIIDCARHKDPHSKIALISPTGRASKRMTEVTGEIAETIHKFLRISIDNPTGIDELDDYQYVICDESSMIDSNLFFILLKAFVNTDTHLIFVGDANQLPPVRAGLPFRDLLDSNIIPKTVLSALFRQNEQSLININANKILNGEPNLTLYNNQINFNFFLASNQDEIKHFMLNCFKTIVYNLPYDLNDIIILSPMNKSLLGVVELNNFFQPYFNPTKLTDNNFFYANDYKIYVGDRVMQTSNNYDLDVFNGDIGYVKKIDKENGEIIVEFDSVKIIYDKKDKKMISEKRLVTYDITDSSEQNLVLAYACTVHKAQGCEFPVVFMPIHPMLVNLSKTLIYTAITRAKNCFAFCGIYDSLYKGILKDTVINRNTLLPIFLKTSENTEKDV